MKQVYNLQSTKVILLLFSLILNSFLVNAQCDLSCLGNVNVSLSINCTATMTPSKVLTSNPSNCNGPLTVQVFDMGDVLIPTSPIITGAYIGQTLKVMVTDEDSGISCWTSAFIEDKIPPVITCVNDTIGCTDEIPMATATDNCGIPDITFIEFQEQLDCSTSDFTFLVTRLYTATDAQGMTATCIQQIHIRKPVAADIIFPPDFDGFDQPTLDCSMPNADPDITGRPTINGQDFADACLLHAFFTDDTVAICEGTFNIFREWKVASWCPSSILAQTTQSIKILDSTGPVINCPSDTIIGTDFDICAATITLPQPTATDDCSSTDNITFSVIWEFGNNFDPTPGVPLGSHIVTYTATDDCGNTSTCTMTITVEDDDPPNVTCEEFRTVGLNQDSTEFCAIDLFNDGSNDNCTAVLDSFCIRRIDNPVFSDCIVFTCDDLGAAPIMVELKVCDEAGNCSFCITEVTLMDNLPPVISFCPPDTTLSCVEFPADTTVTGSPLAMDACGLANISFSDVEDLDNCNAGTVTRTFTVTGIDGLTATCQQILTFNSGDDPVFTFPDNDQTECLAEATTDVTGLPTATDDCSNVFFIGFQDQVFTSIENCKYTISRTFTILNDCDDSDTTGVQIIEVEDLTAPVFDSAANSINYNCADEIVPFIPVATDNCNSVIDVSLESSITTPGSCADNFTRVETYIATDSCGNVSDPFIYTITVNDEVPPTADPLPPLGPFACIEDIPAANISAVIGAVDNCNGPVTIEIVGTEVPTICSSALTRTYRITDRCGNSSDLLQSITINDEIPPTANSLPDLGPFICAENITDPDINDVTGVMDNCNGLVTVSFLSQTSEDNCNSTLIRTYQLTDECGNTSAINQNILIDDNVAPTADQPTLLTNIQCFEDIPAGSEADLSNISDNCIGTVTVTIDDSQLINPGCSGTLNRIYILTDDCGNTSSITREIQIDDQIAPVWDQSPGDLDFNTDCAENINIIPPTATDNCNNATVTVSSDIITEMTCDHRFIRTVTYLATDDCLNNSVPFVITVTVFDNEAPTANPLADAGPFDCITDFPEDTQILTALSDNCSGLVSVSFISDTDSPMCMGTVVRTYEISDVCGNTRQITQNILIEDTSFPTANPLADLGPFTCSNQIPAPDINLVVNSQDNCGETVTVSFLNDETPVRCTGSFLRTYQVSDQCGNTTNITQTIIINDNIPPTLIDPFPEGIFDCVASIPDSLLNNAPGIDNCGGEVISEFLGNDDPFRPLQCMDTLFQLFRLTDACGNDTTIIREIMIMDTIPPVFVEAPGSLDFMIECPIDPTNITPPTAIDACRFIDLIRIVSVDTTSFTCASGYTQEIGYLATDACNNQTLDTFFIEVVVIDTTPPVFTAFPSDTSAIDSEPFPQPLICGEPFVFTAEAVDNCDEVTFRSQIIEDDGSVIDLTGPTIDRDFNTGINTVIYFAEDVCGNEVQDSFTVEVIDATSPFYTCIGSPVFVNVEAGMDVVFLTDLFVASRDDCSATMSATFEGPSPDSIIFNCAMLNGQSTLDTVVQIFLSDVFGNQSPFPCGVVIRVSSANCPTIQSATVAGQLEDEFGNGVDDVVVEIAGPVISQRVESTLGGNYFLPNLEMYEDYEIIPFRNDDLLNGISTMDLILLGQHLLEISTLGSPYQLIAADINNDGNVSALDMIALRRAILIIDEEFQNNTSWRFVDSEFDFPDLTDPFSSSFPESRFIHELSTNELVNNFMAIKVGDLNGNAVISGLQAGDTRSEENLTFFTQDQILEAGKEYQLIFSTENFVNLKGFQFTIDYNPMAITPAFDRILSEDIPNFNDQNIGFTQLENGLLTVSWHDVNPITLSNQAEAFTLNFRAKINTKLSSVLEFNDALLRAESYTSELNTQEVNLEYLGSLIDNNSDTEFALLQNKPNPFRQQTVIPFILPTPGVARIKITDINGRIIANHEAFYEAGYQEYILDKSELNAGGILFYHLQSGEFEATKKMVVIE